jgi:unsaturated rhamnogalacturonyl hydrolase
LQEVFFITNFAVFYINILLTCKKNSMVREILTSFLFALISIVSFSQASDTWAVKFSSAIVTRYQPTIDAMTGKGWEYSNGIVLHGMEKVYLKTKNATYLNYIKAYIDAYVDANGNVTGLGTTVDKIEPGILCLFLYEQTGLLKYKTAAINIKNYLLSSNPVNFHKTADGGYWHKNDGNYDNVMMVDGMYMLHPFLAKCAYILNDPSLYDIATFQMLLLGTHVMATPKTLPKHAWDYTKTKTWADPSTGESTDVWSRGTGWYMMALADVLTYLPASHANYAAILELFQRMASGVAANQDAATGLWYQVVDKPTASGNYLESSGSGMFVYAIKKGIDNGWLNSSVYSPVCQNGWTGMQTKIATYTDNMPQIKGFCPATGVLNNTAAYLALTAVNCPTASGTQHPHGYCGILMAASAMELQPPVTSITSPAPGAAYTTPVSFTINATATDPDGTIAKVEFYQGTTKLGESATSPYSFTWNNVPAGSYDLTVKATDNIGLITTSSTVAITVSAPSFNIFSKRIEAGQDDVEEFANGTVTRTSYALEMSYYSSVAGNQVVGLRFNNVTVPAGATINKAYIQFGATKINYSITDLVIRGEYTGNSAAFTGANNNVTSRTLTSANATWIPAPWTTAGEMSTIQQTPELKTIVQEIIGHASWASGNSMSFIISGTGARPAYSYEGASDKAALLYIEY